MENRDYLNLKTEGCAVRAQAVDALTRQYLATLDGTLLPAEAAEGLLRHTADGIREHNAAVPAGEAWDIPDALEARQAAALILHAHPVCLLPYPGRDSTAREDCRLYIYQDSGLDMGLYTTDVLSVIESYMPGIGLFDEQDIEAVLVAGAEVKARCGGGRFSAVEDGILDSHTGGMLPFSPKHVFTHRSRYEYGEWLVSGHCPAWA